MIKWSMQRIREAAEKAKKELSTATTTNINLPFITLQQQMARNYLLI